MVFRSGQVGSVYLDGSVVRFRGHNVNLGRAGLELRGQYLQLWLL